VVGVGGNVGLEEEFGCFAAGEGDFFLPAPVDVWVGGDVGVCVCVGVGVCVSVGPFPVEFAGVFISI
jgi:hypothetical protein